MKTQEINIYPSDIAAFQQACESLQVPICGASENADGSVTYTVLASVKTVWNLGYHTRQMQELSEVNTKLSRYSYDYASL